MVAQQVQLAPLGSRVRALDIHDDITPWRLLTHAIAPSYAAHRRGHWGSSVLMAHEALGVPSVQVRRQRVPVPCPAENLEGLTLRSMRVKKRLMAMVEKPFPP